MALEQLLYLYAPGDGGRQRPRANRAFEDDETNSLRLTGRLSDRERARNIATRNPRTERQETGTHTGTRLPGDRVQPKRVV